MTSCLQCQNIPGKYFLLWNSQLLALLMTMNRLWYSYQIHPTFWIHSEHHPSYLSKHFPNNSRIQSEHLQLEHLKYHTAKTKVTSKDAPKIIRITPEHKPNIVQKPNSSRTSFSHVQNNFQIHPKHLPNKSHTPSKHLSNTSKNHPNIVQTFHSYQTSYLPNKYITEVKKKNREKKTKSQANYSTQSTIIII